MDKRHGPLRGARVRALQLHGRQPRQHECHSGRQHRDLFFSAITSGGSSAVFFKLNTLGEESFLEKLVPIVENYKKRVE